MTYCWIIFLSSYFRTARSSQTMYISMHVLVMATFSSHKKVKHCQRKRCGCRTHIVFINVVVGVNTISHFPRRNFFLFSNYLCSFESRVLEGTGFVFKYFFSWNAISPEVFPAPLSYFYVLLSPMCQKVCNAVDSVAIGIILWFKWKQRYTALHFTFWPATEDNYYVFKK